MTTMRIGPSLLALLTAAAAAILTSCASSTTNNTQVPTGGGGTNPPTPSKTTPTINWAQPGPISSVTPLGPNQLNAQASVIGTFAYSPAANTVLNVGSHTLTVTFTPSDTSAYNTATASVTIKVVPLNQPATASNCGTPINQGAADFLYLNTGRTLESTHQIFAFAPQPDGSLDPVPGSPFAAPSTNIDGLATLAGAGPVLFANDTVNVYSYAVHNDGCISLENTALVGAGDSANPVITPTRLFMDSAKSTLYVSDYDPGAQASKYLSFAYSPSSGSLNPTGATDEDMLNNIGYLAIDSSSRYAVSSGCSLRGGQEIVEFSLGDNGSLNTGKPAAAPYPAIQSGEYWCPNGAAADHSGHFVVAMAPCPAGEPCYQNGLWQLAPYSIDADGNMTPLGNAQTMPTIKNVPPQSGPNWYQFSPDDRYFAVGSSTSINVYAWDSAGGVLSLVASIPDSEGSCTFTSSSTTCSGNFYGNIAWDRYNHLYTTLGNKLLVYTVTDASVTQAPASPHQIQDPAWLTIVSANAR